MDEINLLPWRVTASYQEKWLGIVVLLSVIIPLILSGLATRHYFANQYQAQLLKNKSVQNRINPLNLKISQIKIIRIAIPELKAHIQILNNLNVQRPQILFLINEIIKTLPNTVLIHSLMQERGRVTLEGYSQSHLEVTEFMQKLHANSWIKNSVLVRVTKTSFKPTKSYFFQIQFTFNPVIIREKLL